MHTYIILPTFNESGTILNLLKRFKEHDLGQPYSILIVDDGSYDNTPRLIRNIKDLPIQIKTHPENRGLGEAIKTGFISALDIAKPNDAIVVMDADDTHNPNQINKMLLMLTNGYDVIIASRFQKGAEIKGVPINRQLYSRVASALFQKIYPIQGVKDYTCGYRTYRASILQNAFNRWGNSFINETGFSCMVDIILKLDYINAKMTEIPLVLRYDRKVGKSKMPIAQNIVKTLELLLIRKIGQW